MYKGISVGGILTRTLPLKRSYYDRGHYGHALTVLRQANPTPTVYTDCRQKPIYKRDFVRGE